MPSSIFISYCRREAPFVDYLETGLEEGGHSVWLDYKKMVPGQPWRPQLAKGINEADILILVVSKESMASKYVKGEFAKAAEKRVILVLFEAVPLEFRMEKCEALKELEIKLAAGEDVKLELQAMRAECEAEKLETAKLKAKFEACEWVDFRSNFDKGMKRLLEIILSPTKPAKPLPKSGFKVSFAVWLALLLSMATAVLSLGAFWTVIIPFYLLPLPYRIIKRDFDYSRVQFSLLILPFALYGSTYTTGNIYIIDLFIGLSIMSLFLVPILFLLLRSNSLQRWGKPMAVRPRFANPYKPADEKITPITYWLDYAPQDQKYATAFHKELKKQNHKPAVSIQEAQSTLVLVSAFKGDSTVSAESQIYYPIILQKNNELSDDLKQIQWIDMRRGLRNMSALSKLLPNPAPLLDALGSAPTSGAQTVMPRSIQALTFYLLILGIFTIGAYIPFIIQLRNDMLSAIGAGLIVSLLIYGVLTFFTISALTSRTASLKRFALALGLLAITWYVLVEFEIQILDASQIYESFDELRGYSGELPYYTFYIGLIPVTLLTFFDRHHFWRWFPAGKGKSQAKRD